MAIFIFRRDLRKYDNTGLIECCNDNDKVYPIFIFTPEQIKNNNYKSNNSIQFMIECIKDLNESLNNKLNLYYGNYIDVINEINKMKEIQIYTNTDYTPYAINRDIMIKNKFDTYIYHDICLNKPGTIKNQNGNNYLKFTPYYNKVINNDIQYPNMTKYDNFYKLRKTKYSIDLDYLDNFYNYNPNNYYKGGRKNGLKQIKKKIIPSEMSPYIKYGCLSIREVYHKFKWNDNLIRQLIWRDFYYDLGYNYTNRFGLSLKEQFDNIIWSKNVTTYEKWCKGMTGFPFIDANMRCLNETGFMSNRGRLVVSSFLVKNLYHDWKKGEIYFANKLIDYDPLVNQGNWQWIVGSSVDSQPYYRILNPWIQSEKHDKHCKFILQWIPELKNVDHRHIHKWYKYYYNYDNIYIEPIIDYNESKEYVINKYKKYI